MTIRKKREAEGRPMPDEVEMRDRPPAGGLLGEGGWTPGVPIPAALLCRRCARDDMTFVELDTPD
jgi:hypothetical protein